MEKSGNKNLPLDLLANVLKADAIRFSKNRKYKEAYNLFKRSSEIWKKLGDIRRSELMMANALENKAKLYREEGNFEKYRMYLLESAKKWSELGIKNNELWCLVDYYQSKAKSMAKNGNLVEERKYEMEAADIWEELGIKKNALRCQANYYISIAKEKYLNKFYDNSIDYYEMAKEIFKEIDNRNGVIWCDTRIIQIMSYIMSNNYEFFESSKLKFEVSENLKNIGLNNESLFVEAQAWSDLATSKKRNKNYDEAIYYFEKASKIYEDIKKNELYYWCIGNINECLYFSSKLGAGLQNIIKYLYRAINAFEKGNDPTAVSILKGDLYKYEGLMLKSKGSFIEALKKFIESVREYNMAYERSIGVASSKLYKQSVIYSQALSMNTRADIEFLNNLDLKTAINYYKQACDLYKESGDFNSVVYCENLHLLCMALHSALEGDFNEALILWEKISNIFSDIVSDQFLRDISRQKMISLLSTFTNIIVKRAEENIKELIEYDKGPSFESRVRELISKFDGRIYTDINGDVFNFGENFILTLYKYDDVKEVNIKPEKEEIGMVFDGKTPINIDVFAKRIRQNRSFIILCECKNRPNYKIKIKDIKLLIKKSKLIQERYNKIEKLLNRYKPKIEEIWYISIGGFTDKAISYSIKNNIKTINKIGLNKLFKEFGLTTQKN